MDKFQYRQISIKSLLSHYVGARYCSCCSERKQQGNIHCRRGNYREISFLIHGRYCGNYDINIAYYTSKSGICNS